MSVWLDEGTEWNKRFYPGMSVLHQYYRMFPEQRTALALAKSPF